MKKLEKVRSAVDRLVSNAELDEANISETEGWLDELQQSILSNIFQGKKFLKLHVEALNLTALTTDLAKLCKKEFEGTTIINLKARSTNIQCDKEALFRILTRALHELKEDISLTGNTPSDTTITLEITDTTIKYVMSSRPNYEKDLPAIRFILTSADALDPSLLPYFYEKEIEDPFELKDYSGTAENVTVNNYIKAHYAATVTTAAENGSTKTFAFPREIYDIRPEGFDKVYYEDRKNFRYDPAALGLELYFLGEIRTIAKKTNHAKAQKAVDFIRKYHYNQTYRTGESFYVHSMQATRILLRLMKYQLDISKSKDTAEIERDVLTGSRIKSTYLELQENQETLIITSLLQHLIDRTAISDSLIETIFGYEIAIYLNSLSNLGRSEVLHQLSQEDLVKSITASRNPTLLCIKLADRLHDLHTIDYVQDVEERKKFAAETSRYFVEVANFLGFHTLERDIASACTYILTHGKLKGFEFRSETMLFLM